MIKKVILSVIFAVLLGFCASCGCSAEEVVGFKDGNTVELTVMQSKTVELTVENVTTVPKWTAKDASVLEITPSEDGLSAVIFGLKAGLCDVEVKTDKAESVLSVTVKATEEVANLSMGLDKVNLRTGGTYGLIPKLTYMEEELNSEFSYVSEDDSIAEVDEEGKITAKALGEVLIRVSAKYHAFEFSSAITVAVEPIIEIKTSFKQTELYVKTDEGGYKSDEDFAVTVKYDNRTLAASEITLSVEDDTIAKLESGSIIGLKAGETRIKISFQLGEKTYNDYAFIKIRDLPKVEILLSDDKVILYEYYREQKLSARLIVDGNELSAESLLSFSSDNSAVATVDGKTVKAVTDGNTSVKVSYNDGIKEYFATANVTVKKSVNLASSELTASTPGITAELKEGKALLFSEQLDLSSATKDDVFIKLHIISGVDDSHSKPDVNYISVRLTDASDPENYITYRINTNISDKGTCYVKAASIDNVFGGWRWGDPQWVFLYDEYLEPGLGEMGTVLGYSFFSSVDSLGCGIRLSYQSESKTAYVFGSNDLPQTIIDLDTMDTSVPNFYSGNGWKAWDGFADDSKVILSVFASGYSADSCKLYIDEIGGASAESYGLDSFSVK